MFNSSSIVALAGNWYMYASVFYSLHFSKLTTQSRKAQATTFR